MAEPSNNKIPKKRLSKNIDLKPKNNNEEINNLSDKETIIQLKNQQKEDKKHIELLKKTVNNLLSSKKGKSNQNNSNNEFSNVDQMIQLQQLQEENKNLKNEIDKSNLNSKYKDEIIKNLNDKMISFKNEYNGLINSLENDYNQSQLQVQHLFSENEKLMKENNDMEMGIKMMNEKVKDSLIMYDNKKNQFIKEVQAYKNKLNEYKIKIITLKRRIDELTGNNIFGYKGNTFALRKDKSAILNHNNIKSFIPNKANYSQGKLNFGFSNNNFI